MQPKILFVDDDRYFARLYKESLEKVFTVIVCYDAKTAIKYFKTEPDLVAAVVDVMMPPPEGRSDDCHDGNTTGLWVLSECCNEIREGNIAILLFTHHGVKYVKDELAFLQLELDVIKVTSKATILAENLPTEVSALISRR